MVGQEKEQGVLPVGGKSKKAIEEETFLLGTERSRTLRWAGGREKGAQQDRE